ncbi:hypothetical protein LguiA_012867 [Lonicera macranthoides]
MHVAQRLELFLIMKKPKQLLEDKVVHNLIPHKGTTLQIVIEKHTMKNYTKRLHFVEQVSMKLLLKDSFGVSIISTSGELIELGKVCVA